jgi:LmbE family N-acetylglucosaminyl deacetylase
MGTSTDAILTYGFQVEEGTAAHETCEALQDERYSEHSAAQKEIGVEALGHCSDAQRMFVIGVIPLTTRAWRGNPVEIVPTALLTNENEARDKLKQFCERFGLPFDEAKCGWWLQSDWT